MTGPLGKNAKYVGRSVVDTPAQERRAQRYAYQRAAAKLLPESRTANCLWAVTSLFAGVDVIRHSEDHHARFNGLQTCGSVWTCPCCSGRISETRREELNQLLAWGRAQGYVPVMLTLTTRHNKGQSLRSLLDGIKGAKRRMVQHRAFKSLRSTLVGYVTATEVNGGGHHGWHPHFHLLMLLRASSEKEAIAQVEMLRSPWQSALVAEGLDGTGAAFQVQGAAAAGSYISKWGAAEELALGAKKSGRAGRSPFQLLGAYADEGDRHAGALFREFAEVFKGRRQLVWSDGLKDLAGIGATSDEEAAQQEQREPDGQDERVANFTPKTWAQVRPHRAAVLKLAEVGGAAGVAAIVQAITGPPSPPPPG